MSPLRGLEGLQNNVHSIIISPLRGSVFPLKSIAIIMSSLRVDDFYSAMDFPHNHQARSE